MNSFDIYRSLDSKVQLRQYVVDQCMWVPAQFYLYCQLLSGFMFEDNRKKVLQLPDLHNPISFTFSPLIFFIWTTFRNTGGEICRF